MITSTANKQIKNLVQLQTKGKARKEQDVFVIEGIKMFEEALIHAEIVKVYVSETFYKTMTEVPFLNEDMLELVSDSVFKEISDTKTPQGILAIVKRPHYELSSIFNADTIRLLILEDIRDPGNLGTMVRTGEGAGFTGVILSKNSVDIFNPKVIRSTMGSIFRIPFYYTDDLEEVLGGCKENGISLYAAHLEGENDYSKEVYTNKCGILIGNEANGLSEEITKFADHLIKIPMEGKVESLNAAVAAAVLMYEIYRQSRK